MDNEKPFCYTYSATERREVENIRKSIFPRKRIKWSSFAA